MPPFRQAPHDQSKADMSLVDTFIPKRTEPDRSFRCSHCDATARWAVTADGVELHVCDAQRKELAITAKSYAERRL